MTVKKTVSWREAYRIAVVEGGVDSGYFLDEMTIYEAMEYLESIAYRNRDWKDMIRMVMMMFTKSGTKPSDVIRFPWDEVQAVAPREDELTRLREKAEKNSTKKKKTMADLVTRIIAEDKQFNDKIERSKKQTKQFGETGKLGARAHC